MTFELKATSRAKQGTGASRRLRKAGQLPGIVYGGSAEAVAINLDSQQHVLHAARRKIPHCIDPIVDR
ncbi:hypothetical protein [Deefgea sp. CFH1-16]|uniref:hypothetical protein n=1 Tax=Deefgea sp. CFH1-16 TaxID=2675457 RepID=UPI0024954F33|nr:hypothetical protein [Deefgea sp. CFH1-16]